VEAVEYTEFSPNIEVSASNLSAVAAERRRMRSWGEFGFPLAGFEKTRQSAVSADKA